MRLVTSLEVLDGQAVSRSLSAGRVARLLDRSPEDIVRSWVDQGVRAVDLVDLDGLFRGTPGLHTIINEIAGSLGVVLQIGGGLRTAHHLREAFGLGVSRACVSTMILQDAEQAEDTLYTWSDRLLVAMEVVDGRVPKCRWAGEDDSVVQIARQLRAWGAARLLYLQTDPEGGILRPDLEALASLARETGLPISVNGGSSSLEELEQLRPLESLGVDEVILGPSLHDGTFSVEDVLQVLEGG